MHIGRVDTGSVPIYLFIYFRGWGGGGVRSGQNSPGVGIALKIYSFLRMLCLYLCFANALVFFK